MCVHVYESSKVTRASESERSRVERSDVGGGRAPVCVCIDGIGEKAEGLLFTRRLFLSPRARIFLPPHRSP